MASATDLAHPPQPPADPRDAPRRQAAVLAVLTTGLCLLVLLEGPRAWGPFSRLLLPVLALSLAGTFAAGLTVPESIADRLAGHPLRCSLGGLAGGLVGLGVSAMLRDRPLEALAARPIGWHLVAGSLVMGGLVGTTSWWLERQRRDERERTRRLFEYQAELLRAQAAAAEAQAARSRIALQLLQAQVEPHFLYNALANLRYLVRHDAELAQRLVDQLVRYFRVALPSLREVEVSLAQELELCAAYAAIQSVRLGDRLRVDIEVAPALREARLPPAVLLTLLENAFKHGAPPDGRPACVTITAQRAAGELRLSVVDNGAGPGAVAGPDRPGSGMGLQWLARRLQAAHGPRARVRLAPAPAGGCCAQLILPSAGEDAA